jgi:tetratricopeptide (TPR) repeat protein
MARLRTLVSAATLLVILSAPLHASAQSAEETAALSLFEKGKTAFKAGEFETALPLFEHAQTVVDNVHTQYYLGRALAAVKQCARALPFLTKVDGQLPPSVEGLRLADENRCLKSASKDSLAKDDCRAALPMLERLSGRLEGAEETWRAEKAKYCSTRATDFPTDTATRKAAYGLYEAAIGAAQGGDAAGAAGLFTKTLALADEPVVRRRLAKVQLSTGGCLPAVKTLEGIPDASRTDADADLRQACGEYAPRANLAGAALSEVVTLVTSGLAAVREGRLADAQHDFDQAAKAGNAPAVEALAIDLLFDLERCKQFAVRIAEASQAVQLALTDIGKRMKACGVDPTVLGVTGTNAGSGSPLSFAAQGGGTDVAKVVSWSLMGTGLACLGVAGLMQLDANALYANASEEVEFANGPGASTGEAADAINSSYDFQDQGDKSMENAQVFVGVGATFVVAGVTMLFWPEGDGAGSAQSADALNLQPFWSSNTVGLAGNF